MQRGEMGLVGSDADEKVVVVRGMVQSWFTPEKVKSMRPYIDKTVNELLDRTISRGCAHGPVDLVTEFALPVPSYVSWLA